MVCSVIEKLRKCVKSLTDKKLEFKMCANSRSWSRRLEPSLLAGIIGEHFGEKPTRIARLRLERKKERPTRITFGGGWNEEIFLPTRITAGVVGTKVIWSTRITSWVVGTE